MVSRRAPALAPLLLLATFPACSDPAPAAAQFASADAVGSGDQGGLPDGDPDAPAPSDAAGAPLDAAPDASVDTAAPGDAADPADAAPGPTCHGALACLVDLKQWSPGQAIPTNLSCMKGISLDESAEVDALLACVDAKCQPEFAAWDKGGPAELSALYLCLIEKCAGPTSACIGGHGPKHCGDALKCLGTCPPLDQACTTACLQPTTPAQSLKTGAFLECVFASCPLKSLPTCAFPTMCALKCPEVAG